MILFVVMMFLMRAALWLLLVWFRLFVAVGRCAAGCSVEATTAPSHLARIVRRALDAGGSRGTHHRIEAAYRKEERRVRPVLGQS